MAASDLTNVDFMLTEAQARSLRSMSEKRCIDIDVLARLAIFDFLVKFNNYKGDESERQRYQFLYDHIAINPAEKALQQAREKVRNMDLAI